MTPEKRSLLKKGVVIPAHPLALTSRRTLDERRQRALTRYYLAAGAGGIAVGVHTTQFAIRDAGLLQPVLALAAEEEKLHKPLTLKIAGICGAARQAAAEAALARDLGYDIGLLSLAALPEASEDQLIAHATAVGETIPLFGFYLQPAVGGRVLSYSFWRRFADLPSVVGIKMAPFNRYQTLDVLRAVAESGRADEIALYTGNDDNLLIDLLTEFRFGPTSVRIVGGLLGHWSVWTRKAVELLGDLHRAGGPTPELLTRAAQITDSNAAFFDAANGFRGCIAGLHEVLRRQGLLEGIWCLDPQEGLSPGQKEEIDRVYRAYPALHDDDFVARYRDLWLKP
ncbi:MAG TPA: dihydrodipicolinate synthase family protein [Planctomycetota bacterium]|nr:dihydrodipicolinate synthase family protein [Planctomycetota bacterium]